MSEKAREDGKAFAEFLQGLSPDEIAKANLRQTENAKAEHLRFQQSFQVNECYLCDEILSSFESNKPCLHWLLRPTGFTKRHFVEITRKFSFFQIQSYLRWIANEEALAQNINDLSDEGTGKLIELTIRYKEYEWAFSCGETDYQGHQSRSRESRAPHYHFQMRVNREPFIRYNDFHIPFSREDVIEIEAMLTSPDTIKRHFTGGEGMNDLLNDDTVEEVVLQGIATADEENAPFKMDSFIVADEGKTISGDDIADLIKKAENKGVPVASLLSNLPNVQVQTIVTPGPGVVEQATRLGRKKRK